MEVNVSGTLVPPPLKRIELTIGIAGQTFRTSYAAQPNLKYSFTWNGRDAYGRVVQGTRDATVTLGYVYGSVYVEPAQTKQAWATTTGVPVTGSSDRSEITFLQSWAVPLGQLNVQPTGFGGWTFSAQRMYDGRGRVLYDGTANVAADAQRTNRLSLDTVAGNGQCCDSGEGGPATSAKLYFPETLATGPDGSFYVSELWKVKKIDPQGVITTIAGNGVYGFTPDGLPAAGNMTKTSDMAVGPDNTVYLNDYGAFRIRRIVDGLLTTVAGTGHRASFSPPPIIDGLPATSVDIDPEAITVAPDGTLYIAERYRVTAVGPDGIIHTLAGPGILGNWRAGDGASARLASVVPVAIAVGPDGSVYISDDGEAVRRITPDGLINRFAGKYFTSNAPSGDGGVATDAVLRQPWGLAVAADGTVIIGTAHGRTIRSVAPSGIITTIAGTNATTNATLTANGSLASGTSLSAPWDVKIAADGSLLFIDYNLNVVRRAASVFPPMRSGAALIPSPDGSEVYVFENGRHVRTVDAMTSVVLYQLAYDANGLLTSITCKPAS